MLQLCFTGNRLAVYEYLGVAQSIYGEFAFCIRERSMLVQNANKN
jgi:hypothetical protein